MSADSLIDWLMAEGGPVIRWRTVAELGVDVSPEERVRLRSELFAHPEVLRWLDQLRRCDRRLHHGQDGALENIGGKLYELGVRAGDPEVAALLALWNRRLAEHPQSDLEFGAFGATIVAAVLARLGCRDAAVAGWIHRRLRAIAPVARARRFDIYIDIDTFGDCPPARRNHPLIDPALYAGSDWELQLPLIHDLYALSAAGVGDQAQADVDAVIDYILDPAYQALHEGYGNLRLGPRRYYGMGWSVHLPGFPNTGGQSPDRARTLLRVELMAQFAAARRSDWFARMLAHLDSFRQADGRWRLPAEYLTEREGYYVLGYHMGLGENRRRPVWRELESTFRMLRLHRLAAS